MPLAARIIADRTATNKRPIKQFAPYHPRITPISSPSTNSILNRKPACACGGGCPKCKSELGIQPKLKIGAPNNKYEQEADRVADQVMRMPEPQMQRQPLEEESEQIQAESLGTPVTSLIQRQPEEEEEEELQTKSLIQRQESENEEEELLQTKSGHGQTPHPGTSIPSHIQDLKSNGQQPLDTSTRAFMEPRLGKDFSQVLLHTGSRAAETAKAINAKAYTMGRDVVFGAGQYHPETAESKRLLAHELTHIIQQNKLPQLRYVATGSQQRFSALSGAVASGGNIQRKEFNKKTDETARKLEPFADDMMREMKPPEDLKKLRKRIITALKAFSLSQLRRMKKAGVRFWLAPGFPPKLEKFILPPKLVTPAQYIEEARVIRVRAHTKTGHIRHELAHAWDHARNLKGKRLRRFDALSRKQITKEIERGTRMWSSSKRLKKMLKKYKDRLPHPVKEHTFESPVTGEKHSLASVADFYAEGYNVFHGHYLSGQARLLRYAPELYKLLEKEAKKNNLQIPNRKEVEKEIKLQKLP